MQLALFYYKTCVIFFINYICNFAFINHNSVILFEDFIAKGMESNIYHQTSEKITFYYKG